MKPTRQHGEPVVVRGDSKAGTAKRLQRIELERQDISASHYNEAWLQRLIQANPELLPIEEIEPAYTPVIPVCMELPTAKGYRGRIDNFFITPNGNLLFAECKLWRNPESRRQVIAQVMDYVESLTAWNYADLEKAVANAIGDSQDFTSLYALVEDQSDIDEPKFIDTVSRNLQLGRGLFFVVGDGIREETETLAEHLQAHAGIHFALVLTEIALYELPNSGGVLAHPRLIARTVNIERGIVRLDDTRMSVEPPKNTVGSASASRPQTLSEEEYFERLGEKNADLPERLQSFLDRIQRLGVIPTFKKTLILRWHAMDGAKLSLGYIETLGYVHTMDINGAQAENWGVLDHTHRYIEELAQLIGGEISTREPDGRKFVSINGGWPRIDQLLDHSDEWFDSIARLTQRIAREIDDDSAARTVRQ